MSRAAALKWTDDSGTHTYELAFPLLEVSTDVRRRRWGLEARSGRVHVERSARRAHEIQGMARFISADLLRILSARIGLELTYIEERQGISVEYPSVLISVSPGGAWSVGLDPDPERYGHGEWAAAMVLRRVDGGTYESLYKAVEQWYVVSDADGGYSLSAEADDALDVIRDGDGYAFAVGTPALRLMNIEPWHAGIEFFDREN